MKKKVQKPTQDTIQEGSPLLLSSLKKIDKKKVVINQGTRIIKHIDSKEWLYARGENNAPTLCYGASFVNPTVGSKAIADINRAGWPDIFHCCAENDLKGVSSFLTSGQAKINARNPRVSKVKQSTSFFLLPSSISHL